MNIIPVLDLLNGVVVHAKKGLRTEYQPIKSQLTTSNKVIDIVKAFLAIYPFSTLYIADLDAIQKTTYSNNFSEIEKIRSEFPGLKIWLDAGIHHPNELLFWEKLEVHPVIGSENFTHFHEFSILSNALNGQFSLSLDFMPTGYQGPIELLSPQHWPTEVLAMVLNKVGANNGVDLTTIQSMLSKKNHHHIYAAGGIRDLQDLMQLKHLNVHGALIASALHNKQLSHQDIASLQLK